MNIKFKSYNLLFLEFSKNTLLEDLIEKLSDKYWKYKGFYKTKSKEGVVEKIADHAAILYKSTSSAAADGPVRGLMPQTAELSPETNKMKAIAKGAVNWNPEA